MTLTTVRTIQWYGILRPPADVRIYKWWRLTADLIRPPETVYMNARFPVPETFIGYVQAISANRVEATWRQSYDNQIIHTYRNDALYLHQSISCSLEAILTSFVNLEVGLGLIPVQRNNPIKHWAQAGFIPEEFRVRLLTENTVCQIIFEYELQESCDVPGAIAPPNPPANPPFYPGTPFPPSTPNSEIPPISPAYDGADDGGKTYNPNSGGNNGQGNECTTYNLTFTYEIDSNGNGEFNTQQEVARVYGKVYSLSVKRNQAGDPNVFCLCNGLPDYESCLATPSDRGITGFVGLGTAAIIRNPVIISLS